MTSDVAAVQKRPFRWIPQRSKPPGQWIPGSGWATARSRRETWRVHTQSPFGSSLPISSGDGGRALVGRRDGRSGPRCPETNGQSMIPIGIPATDACMCPTARRLRAQRMCLPLVWIRGHYFWGSPTRLFFSPSRPWAWRSFRAIRNLFSKNGSPVSMGFLFDINLLR